VSYGITKEHLFLGDASAGAGWADYAQEFPSPSRSDSDSRSGSGVGAGAGAGPGAAVVGFDFSPSYYRSAQALERAHDMLGGGVKLLWLVRDPVEQFCYKMTPAAATAAGEHQSWLDGLRQCADDVNTDTAADPPLELTEPARNGGATGGGGGRGCAKIASVMGRLCYVDHLMRWAATFGMGSTLVVQHSSLLRERSERQQVLDAVAAFIGVRQHAYPSAVLDHREHAAHTDHRAEPEWLQRNQGCRDVMGREGSFLQQCSERLAEFLADYPSSQL
jgi:hypothetical protein